MKQSDLEKRRQSLNIVSGDADDDFEEIVASSRSPASSDTKITMLPLDSLVEYTDDTFEALTGRPQPFKAYSTENLESLAKSIKENGVINPIIVKPLEDGTYQILAGRNRTRASKLCGKQTVPAIIRTDIKELKVLDACGAVTEDSLNALFIRPEKPKVPSITISSDTLQEYADILPDQKEVERLFLEFLKTYRCSVN